MKLLQRLPNPFARGRASSIATTLGTVGTAKTARAIDFGGGVGASPANVKYADSAAHSLMQPPPGDHLAPLDPSTDKLWIDAPSQLCQDLIALGRDLPRECLEQQWWTTGSEFALYGAAIAGGAYALVRNPWTHPPLLNFAVGTTLEFAAEAKDVPLLRRWRHAYDTPQARTLYWLHRAERATNQLVDYRSWIRRGYNRQPQYQRLAYTTPLKSALLCYAVHEGSAAGKQCAGEFISRALQRAGSPIHGGEHLYLSTLGAALGDNLEQFLESAADLSGTESIRNFLNNDLSAHILRLPEAMHPALQTWQQALLSTHDRVRNQQRINNAVTNPGEDNVSELIDMILGQEVTDAAGRLRNVLQAVQLAGETDFLQERILWTVLNWPDQNDLDRDALLTVLQAIQRQTRINATARHTRLYALTVLFNGLSNPELRSGNREEDIVGLVRSYYTTVTTVSEFVEAIDEAILTGITGSCAANPTPTSWIDTFQFILSSHSAALEAVYQEFTSTAAPAAAPTMLADIDPNNPWRTLQSPAEVIQAWSAYNEVQVRGARDLRRQAEALATHADYAATMLQHLEPNGTQHHLATILGHALRFNGELEQQLGAAITELQRWHRNTGYEEAAQFAQRAFAHNLGGLIGRSYTDGLLHILENAFAAQDPEAHAAFERSAGIFAQERDLLEIERAAIATAMDHYGIGVRPDQLIRTDQDGKPIVREGKAVRRRGDPHRGGGTEGRHAKDVLVHAANRFAQLQQPMLAARYRLLAGMLGARIHYPEHELAQELGMAIEPGSSLVATLIHEHNAIDEGRSTSPGKTEEWLTTHAQHLPAALPHGPVNSPWFDIPQQMIRHHRDAASVAPQLWASITNAEAQGDAAADVFAAELFADMSNAGNIRKRAIATAHEFIRRSDAYQAYGSEILQAGAAHLRNINKPQEALELEILAQYALQHSGSGHDPQLTRALVKQYANEYQPSNGPEFLDRSVGGVSTQTWFNFAKVKPWTGLEEFTRAHWPGASRRSQNLQQHDSRSPDLAPSIREIAELRAAMAELRERGGQ